MRRWILATCVWAVAASAAAQTTYQLQYYVAGVDPATGAPAQVQDVPAPACAPGSSPADPGPVTNPRSAAWNGVGEHAGQVCSVALSSIPIGLDYRATATASNIIGTSPRSAPSNVFTVGSPPGAPTNLRVLP